MSTLYHVLRHPGTICCSEPISIPSVVFRHHAMPQLLLDRYVVRVRELLAEQREEQEQQQQQQHLAMTVPASGATAVASLASAAGPLLVSAALGPTEVTLLRALRYARAASQRCTAGGMMGEWMQPLAAALRAARLLQQQRQERQEQQQQHAGSKGLEDAAEGERHALEASGRAAAKQVALALESAAHLGCTLEGGLGRRLRRAALAAVQETLPYMGGVDLAMAVSALAAMEAAAPPELLAAAALRLGQLADPGCGVGAVTHVQVVQVLYGMGMLLQQYDALRQERLQAEAEQPALSRGAGQGGRRGQGEQQQQEPPVGRPGWAERTDCTLPASQAPATGATAPVRVAGIVPASSSARHPSVPAAATLARLLLRPDAVAGRQAILSFLHSSVLQDSKDNTDRPGETQSQQDEDAEGTGDKGWTTWQLRGAASALLTLQLHPPAELVQLLSDNFVRRVMRDSSCRTREGGSEAGDSGDGMSRGVPLRYVAGGLRTMAMLGADMALSTACQLAEVVQRSCMWEESVVSEASTEVAGRGGWGSSSVEVSRPSHASQQLLVRCVEVMVARQVVRGPQEHAVEQGAAAGASNRVAAASCGSACACVAPGAEGEGSVAWGAIVKAAWAKSRGQMQGLRRRLHKAVGVREQQRGQRRGQG